MKGMCRSGAQPETMAADSGKAIILACAHTGGIAACVAVKASEGSIQLIVSLQPESLAQAQISGVAIYPGLIARLWLYSQQNY